MYQPKFITLTFESGSKFIVNVNAIATIYPNQSGTGSFIEFVALPKEYTMVNESIETIIMLINQLQ